MPYIKSLPLPSSFFVCASNEGFGDTVPSTGASENWLPFQIFYKYRKPHELAHFFTKQQFSAAAFAQSCCCYSDLHTGYMNVIVGIHLVMLNRFIAFCPRTRLHDN